jgi:hypothetical protein
MDAFHKINVNYAVKNTLVISATEIQINYANVKKDFIKLINN